jgi:hypothetical protein
MTSKDHAISSFRAVWPGFAISVPLLPVVALGQCSDGLTTTVHHNGNLVRSGSNQVWSWSQSFVTGAYTNTWSVSVSATTAHNGSQTHSGQDSASGTEESPAPTYTTPSAPYPNNTVYLTGAHQFFSGTTSGGGWQVYDGTIRYYLDHGDNNP